MQGSRLLGPVAAVALGTMPGCATVNVPLASGVDDAAAKAFSVIAGAANVYVYRRSPSVATIGYAGGGGYPITAVGAACTAGPMAASRPFGKQGHLGSLYPRTFLVATVCPGPTTISTIGEGDPRLEFIAEEGKNYYVKLTALMGWAYPSARLELVAAGQAVVEGTYYRTATTCWGQPFPQTRPDPVQGTLIISGNTIENIERLPSRDPEFRLGATFTVSGTNISYSVTCSTEASMVGQTFLGPFSYANGVLKTYDTGTKKESVFTR